MMEFSVAESKEGMSTIIGSKVRMVIRILWLKRTLNHGTKIDDQAIYVQLKTNWTPERDLI